MESSILLFSESSGVILLRSGAGAEQTIFQKSKIGVGAEQRPKVGVTTPLNKINKEEVAKNLIKKILKKQTLNRNRVSFSHHKIDKIQPNSGSSAENNMKNSNCLTPLQKNGNIDKIQLNGHKQSQIYKRTFTIDEEDQNIFISQDGNSSQKNSRQAQLQDDQTPPKIADFQHQDISQKEQQLQQQQNEKTSSSPLKKNEKGFNLNLKSQVKAPLNVLKAEKQLSIDSLDELIIQKEQINTSAKNSENSEQKLHSESSLKNIPKVTSQKKTTSRPSFSQLKLQDLEEYNNEQKIKEQNMNKHKFANINNNNNEQSEQPSIVINNSPTQKVRRKQFHNRTSIKLLSGLNSLKKTDSGQKVNSEMNITGKFKKHRVHQDMEQSRANRVKTKTNTKLLQSLLARSIANKNFKKLDMSQTATQMNASSTFVSVLKMAQQLEKEGNTKSVLQEYDKQTISSLIPSIFTGKNHTVLNQFESVKSYQVYYPQNNVEVVLHWAGLQRKNNENFKQINKVGKIQQKKKQQLLLQQSNKLQQGLKKYPNRNSSRNSFDQIGNSSSYFHNHQHIKNSCNLRNSVENSPLDNSSFLRNSDENIQKRIHNRKQSLFNQFSIQRAISGDFNLHDVDEVQK